MTPRDSSDADLVWLRDRLPPAPAADAPLTRRTVAGALERGRGRRPAGMLWPALAFAGAAAAVLALGQFQAAPPQEALVVVPAESENDWAGEELAVEVQAEEEVVIPEPPGMLDPDSDELTDEELASVTWQLVLPSRS